MKKIYTIILLVFATITNASAILQEDAKHIIRQEVDAAAKMYVGKDIDYMTTAAAIFFDEQNVHYVYVIDEDYCALKDLNLDTGKYNAIRYWNDSQFDYFRSCLQALGGRIIYTYVGSKSRVSRTFYIYP